MQVGGSHRVQPWRKKLQGLERRNKPIISTLRRLRLEDCHEFQVNLDLVKRTPPASDEEK